jgi:anti-sigma factor RsiW
MSTALTSLDRKLLRWLDEDESKFERYIAKHPEAADRVERLLELGADAQNLMQSALSAAVAAPVDLVERLTVAVGKDRDTGPGSSILDLMGVGIATLVLWAEPPSD